MSTQVQDIMSLNVITINTQSSFSQACRIFKEFNIHHLPVVDEDQQFIGMFSATDALSTFSNKLQNVHKAKNQSIDDYFSIEDNMSEDVLFTIDPLQSIKKAHKLLVEAKVHALVVLSDKKIVGILTYSDLLDYYEINCK